MPIAYTFFLVAHGFFTINQKEESRGKKKGNKQVC